MRRTPARLSRSKRPSPTAALALLLLACGGPDGPAEERPGSVESPPSRADTAPTAPEVFARGAISSADANETWITFTRDGREALFSRYADDFGEQALYISTRGEEGWSAGRPAPFSGRWSDRAPYVAPDGRLYFSSTRPTAPGAEGGRWRIWVAERSAGAWGEPVPLPEAVNGDGGYHPAVAADGTLFWASSERPEGLGRSDIYEASPAGGGYGAPRNLGPPVNTAASEPDLYIDPERRWMVLVATEREGGHGGDDLWLSRRTASGWSEPVNLGEPVNTPEYEYGPFIAGDWLYFASHRSGHADIYRIRTLDVAPLAAVIGSDRTPAP